MKIGILTYHRSHNYGALLQAVALRYRLSQMGHKVYFIDYWPEYHRQMYALYSIRRALRYGIKGAIRYTWNAIAKYQRRKERYDSFRKFIQTYIEPYCAPYTDKEKYDVIVYGSDQIWRKQPGLSGRFNPVYFADNILRADKHIAYAASMGIVDLTEKDKGFLKNKLGKFTRISVRENNLSEALKEMGIQNEVVLDPTLLLSSEEWERLTPIKRVYNEKYVLYYRLQAGAFDERAIENFAKGYGCKLLILEGSVGKKKNNILSAASPTEFLSLMKNADYVFTSSYHGLLFSLMFHKEFYASFSANSSRAESILSKLNLTDRLLCPKSKFIPNSSPIDYEAVWEIFCKSKQTSISILLYS